MSNMSTDACRLTVFTPLFNRRHTIHRAYESLMKQTCKNFEWLIIDDGSTDNASELIESYKENADFKIRYFYKENGGKHTAWNMALGLITTDYFVCLDSDDALSDTAIEKMLATWDSIGESSRNNYWCVVGLDTNAETGEIIGDKFPEGINSCENPSSIAASVGGDKFGCLSHRIAKVFPFPEPKDTTFITESIVWNKIDKIYKQYYLNEVFCIVYRDEENSLSSSWYRNHVREGYVSNYYWKMSVLNDVGLKSFKDIKLLFQIAYYGRMAERSCRVIIKSVETKKYRPAVALLLIPAAALKLLHGNKLVGK